MSSLMTFRNSAVLQRGKKQDRTHPGLFAVLSSGRRYRRFSSKTNRPKKRVLPLAIRTLNANAQFFCITSYVL